MVQIAHLPALSNFDAVLDVMALCAHFEVANAMYRWDGDSGDERIKMTHFFIRNRKRARELIDWISSQYIFRRDGDEINFKEYVYWPYVAKVARLCYLYRERTDKTHQRKPVTAPRVLDMLRRCFNHASTKEILAHFEHMMKEDVTEELQTFLWTGPSIDVDRSEIAGDYVYGE